MCQCDYLFPVARLPHTIIMAPSSRHPQAAAAAITAQLDQLDALLDGRKAAAAPPRRRRVSGSGPAPGADGRRPDSPGAASVASSARPGSVGGGPPGRSPGSSASMAGPAGMRSSPSAASMQRGSPGTANGGGGGSPPGRRGDGSGGKPAPAEVPAAPLERCRAILECADSLRKALLRQAKVRLRH